MSQHLASATAARFVLWALLVLATLAVNKKKIVNNHATTSIMSLTEEKVFTAELSALFRNKNKMVNQADSLYYIFRFVRSKTKVAY